MKVDINLDESFIRLRTLISERPDAEVSFLYEGEVWGMVRRPPTCDPFKFSGVAVINFRTMHIQQADLDMLIRPVNLEITAR